jgi:hypothetical protein
MTFTLHRLRTRSGRRVENPPGTSVTLDIDKNRRAIAFVGERVHGELAVMEFEAHAKGLYLRGVESDDGGKTVRYQEWYLAYAP